MLKTPSGTGVGNSIFLVLIRDMLVEKIKGMYKNRSFIGLRRKLGAQKIARTGIFIFKIN